MAGIVYLIDWATSNKKWSAVINSQHFFYNKKERAGIALSSRVVSNQVFSALMSLTSVFGMGTGGSSSLMTPTVFLYCFLFRQPENWIKLLRIAFFSHEPRKRSSPRPISTSKLNTSLHLHFKPIYLIVFKGSYSFKKMAYLILRPASRLDAFSVYPFRT